MSDYDWTEITSANALGHGTSALFAHSIQRQRALMQDSMDAIYGIHNDHLAAHERGCEICIKRISHAAEKARIEEVLMRVMER